MKNSITKLIARTIKIIEDYPDLEELEIDGDGIYEIKNCPKLKSINTNADFTIDDKSTITYLRTNAKEIADFPNLCEVSFWYCDSKIINCPKATTKSYGDEGKKVDIKPAGTYTDGENIVEPSELVSGYCDDNDVVPVFYMSKFSYMCGGLFELECSSFYNNSKYSKDDIDDNYVAIIDHSGWDEDPDVDMDTGFADAKDLAKLFKKIEYNK